MKYLKFDKKVNMKYLVLLFEKYKLILFGSFLLKKRNFFYLNKFWQKFNILAYFIKKKSSK